MSHTPEPWYENENTIDSDTRLVAGIGSIRRDGDLKRIVACVNACAGIPTEHLITGETIILHGGIYNELVIAQRQRDELLEVMQKAHDLILNRSPDNHGDYDAMLCLSEAIAKAQGDKT
jgi:hypothetical protein